MRKMKRFSIKLWNGRCIIFDWKFVFPLEIRLGYYGKRSVEELEKLRDLLND